MPVIIFLAAATALSASPTPAAGSAFCDAKPFTLKKSPPPAAEKPAPPKVVAAPAKAPQPKPKPKFDLGCKQPK